MSGPSTLKPLLTMPGTNAAIVMSASGAKPLVRKIPASGGGLPSPVPGISAMSATTSGSRCRLTASFRSSSGTVKSNSAPSAITEPYP